MWSLINTYATKGSIKLCNFSAFVFQLRENGCSISTKEIENKDELL